MISKTLPMKKTYLLSPPPTQPLSGPAKLLRLAVGAGLAPLYWLAAGRRLPGWSFQLRCAEFGLYLLFRRQAPLKLGWIYQFLFSPMDSTRYFEFDFAWGALRGQPIQHYLDVSSPRLFLALLMHHRPELCADLINPDGNDQALTTQLFQAAGLAQRCRWYSTVVDETDFAPESFDLITSISVIEHIPQDREAVLTLWRWLKPGGRLLLTVPCAAQESEQYINYNEYGVLTPDETGFVFWQRFYDEARLEANIYSLTGAPVRRQIYGEKVAGTFLKNASQKRAGYATTYRFWREPYMMSRDYAFFSSLAELPGEGVIALEFIKP